MMEERIAKLEVGLETQEKRQDRYEDDYKDFLRENEKRLDGISRNLEAVVTELTLLRKANGNGSKKGYVATGGVVGAIVVLAEVVRGVLGG